MLDAPNVNQAQGCLNLDLDRSLKPALYLVVTVAINGGSYESLKQKLILNIFLQFLYYFFLYK